jgi:hypothetical protein
VIVGTTTVVSKQHMTWHKVGHTNVCKYKIKVELMQQKCASSKEHALGALMYAQVAYSFAMLCVAAPHHACCSDDVRYHHKALLAFVGCH